MDLSTARTRVRLYINEPKADHFTDANLTALIQEANYEVYARVVAAAPDRYGTFGTFTVPVESTSLNVSTATRSEGGTMGRWVKVLALVQSKPTSSTPSQNTIHWLQPCTKMADMFIRPDVARLQTESSTAGGNPSGSSVAGTYVWKFMGSNLYLFPYPTEALQLTMWYVPVVYNPTADGHYLLSTDGTTEMLPEFAEVVVLLAAVKARAAVMDQDSMLAQVYKSRLESMITALATMQQSVEPARIKGYT